jgi:hypothetical protein
VPVEGKLKPIKLEKRPTIDWASWLFVCKRAYDKGYQRYYVYAARRDDPGLVRGTHPKHPCYTINKILKSETPATV